MLQVKTTIKMLTILLGMICLNSCSGIKNQEICEINFQFNRCRCFWYSFENQERITDSINYPLVKCDKMTGIKSNALAKELIPELKERVRYCKDLEFETNY